MQYPMNPSPELEVALDAAQQAAVIAGSLYQHNIEVRSKADKSPVTEADVRGCGAYPNGKTIRRLGTPVQSAGCGQRISSAVAGPITTWSKLSGCSHRWAESIRRPAINSANNCGYSGTCRGSP